MYDPMLRRDLRAHLLEACEAMLAHKRAVDRVIGEFQYAARESRKTLEASYETLSRLNHDSESRRRT